MMTMTDAHEAAPQARGQGEMALHDPGSAGAGRRAVDSLPARRGNAHRTAGDRGCRKEGGHGDPGKAPFLKTPGSTL